MKFNKADYTKAAIVAAITCILSFAGCANNDQNKVQPSATAQKSNLDDATRENQNGVLDPSFYNSNHELPGSM